MENFKLYSLNCPINPDVVRYIGITKRALETRYSYHINDKTKTHKSNWIKSIKVLGLFPIMNLIDDGFDEETAKRKEIEYIKLFKSFGANLTNTTNGGDGFSGYKFTENDKIKMSLSHIGKPGYWAGRQRSMETNKKISETLTGTPLSEETKNKISISLKGKKKPKRTEEHKANIGKALRGRKNGALTEEHRRNISIGNKGKKSWNKGQTNACSLKTLEKMSASAKAYCEKNKTRKIGELDSYC